MKTGNVTDTMQKSTFLGLTATTRWKPCHTQGNFVGLAAYYNYNLNENLSSTRLNSATIQKKTLSGLVSLHQEILI